MTEQTLDFTLEALDWTPWVVPVDPATATSDQLAVLDGLGSWARRNGFALTLVHDPAIFVARSQLSDQSMGEAEPGVGLPQSDREFAALVESRVNGCRYCAFIHGNESINLGGDEAAVRSIIDVGPDAELPARLAAIAAYAANLAVTPPTATTEHIQQLRDVGLTTSEILDLTYAIAQFAWANRTMLTLGGASRKGAAHE